MDKNIEHASISIGVGTRGGVALGTRMKWTKNIEHASTSIGVGTRGGVAMGTRMKWTRTLNMKALA